MSSLSFPLELIDDGTGVEFQSPLVTCECSNVDPETDEGMGSDTFHIFFDQRFNPPHLHIQCYDCSQTYCLYNQCVPPPTAEIYEGQT